MKAVLFDFDGTLVDTQIWYNIAISSVLSRYNKKYTVEFCSDFFDGRCWTDVLADIAQEEKFNSNAILEEAVALAQSLILQNIKPNDGVVEILEILSRSSVKYAICSNSKTPDIHLALQKSSLDKYFGANVFGRDLVAKGKPASDIYMLGLQKLGSTPSETFAVEDSVHGAKASIDAKIPTIIFSGASHFKNSHKTKFIQNFGSDIKFFSNMIEATEYMVYA
jgi:HAD superfamily hydrolase (TIGR01509 family)